MQYDEFKEKVCREFDIYMQKAYDNSLLREDEKVKTLFRNNGLDFEITGRTSVAFVEFQKLYELYKEFKSFDKMMNDYVIRIIIYAELICGRRDVREKATLHIANTWSSWLELPHAPHREIFDMSLLCTYDMEFENDIVMSFVIPNVVLHENNIGEDELFSHAMENTRKQSIFEEIAPGLLSVTNKRHLYGAAGIIDTQILGKLAERVNSDLYILPVTIHAGAVLFDKIAPKRMVLDMYEKLDWSLLKEEEILSRNLYHYSRETNEIKIIIKKNNGRCL